MLYLNYEGMIHVWLDSPFAMLPAIGLLLTTIEPRIKEAIAESAMLKVVYRLIPAEIVDLRGIQPLESIVWYAGLWVIILVITGVLFHLRDG
jgi:hypothetical protein